MSEEIDKTTEQSILKDEEIESATVYRHAMAVLADPKNKDLPPDELAEKITVRVEVVKKHSFFGQLQFLVKEHFKKVFSVLLSAIFTIVMLYAEKLASFIRRMAE
jgi:hypothetical protein